MLPPPPPMLLVLPRLLPYMLDDAVDMLWF
jgi:hypothetical protein